MYFEPQGENDWLDTVLTYITLKDNGVITFPFSGDLDFENVALDKRAEPISNKAYPLIVGQTIKELWYERDEDDEVANDWMAFIELSNGVVIHENRMAPHGTGAANLFMYDARQFSEKRNSKDHNLISLTAYLNQVKT
jgi:hypothetical protein